MKLNKHQKSAIVMAIMNDVPAPNKTNRHADLQAAVVKAMSPEVRRIYKKKPSALRLFSVGITIVKPGDPSTLHIVSGDVEADVVRSLIEPYREEDWERHMAKIKLQQIVEGCTTLKQLQTALPEFKHYMPTERTPTPNLPVAHNVAAELSKLGWPKEKNNSQPNNKGGAA